MENILIKAFRVFMQRGDYDNAFVAVKKLWGQIETRTDRDVVYALVKEFRDAVRHVDSKEARELHKRSYLLTAREIFDDFMLYVEWNRPLAQQYWLPRRKKLKRIADALQALEDDELDELFLSMPPRVGKTTLVMFFVLWAILRDSERSNLYCSYSDGVVAAFYKGLLEILQDPYTYAWQDVFPEARIASTNAKDLLLNIGRDKRYASFTGRSVGGSLNGSVDCNHLSIADDMVSGIEEAMNKERLMSLWGKVENNYLPRGKETAKHLWIGTRWSLIDPQGMRMDLLKNEPKFASVRWKAINVPALNEKDESNFDYACGVGFTTEQYQQRRASFERNNDMASWLAQYGGEPIERDGAVFAPDQLRFYNGVLPDDTPDRVFMAIDPAWGGGDFCAGPICFQYGDFDIYVVDVVYSDAEKNITQPLIAAKAEEHGVQAITIEATRMTAAYADGVEEELQSRGQRVNVQRSTSHYTGNGKEQRIFDKAPDIRAHMIFLGEGHRSKEYELFMQNVYSFTVNKKNKHDDAPDSLAMAINAAFYVAPEVQILNRSRYGI